MLVSAADLRAWLTDGSELALLDAREQGVYFRSHLFHAACVPLSCLELDLPRLVPRRDTLIVWCDDGEGLAERAAAKAAELGYSQCRVLNGGINAWAESGGELYSGVNVASKAFGEFVEHAYGTPRIPASELKAMLDDGTDLVVLDSRPIEEFRRMSIPTGVDCPGAELVHRVKEMAPDLDTLVVVNCAGRTRSIIGSQSLINAGLENRVVALENGTMGWELAGYQVARGHETHAPDPTEQSQAWSLAAVAAVAKRFGVVEVGPDRVQEWQADPARTTYLLDVRTPGEFHAAHLTGSRNAPGGQLVQATDEYVATHNARIVLVDDNGVRATMTASWLRQLGWTDAVVLAGGIDGARSAGHQIATGPVARMRVPTVAMISVADLAARLGASSIDRDSGQAPGAPGSVEQAGLVGVEDLVVIDIGTSLKYRQKGHIPGAWWGVRTRLAEARSAVGDASTVVLTSTDGQLAKLAVPDAAKHWPDAKVFALAGGNRAWRHAGHAMEPGFTRPTTSADDVWYKPYDHEDGVPEEHMRGYLSWEIALADKIERDPTVHFDRY